MAWYRTGTVTTTASATVVGAGTAWVASVVAGDLFTVDAQKFYEVSAVNNDGSITLQTAYVGTVGAGQSYAIIRTSDSTATLALSLSSMISAWHLTLDQLLNWLTSTTNTTLTNPATGISTTVITPAQLTASAVGSVSKTVTTADVTLTTADSANGFITVSGALTGNRNLVFPATQSTMCAFTNNCTGAYTLTVKTASGSGVVIAAGERALVYCDGTNVVNAFTATPGINALDVANTPAGNIASTTVQAALNELDTEKATVAQATSAVAITGGSINSTPIGATTPSTGAFTTLSVSNGTLNVTIGPNTVGQSAAGGDLYLQSQTGRHVYTQVGGTSVTDISSSGLAVTGNISATGTIAVSATNAIYSATGTTGWSGYSATKTGGSILFGVDDGSTFGKLSGDGILRVASGKTLYITDTGNVTRVAISSTGLAVTGNISASGRALVGTTTDDGVNALQVNGTIAPKATAATPTINVIGNAGTYAIGNTVNFSYFSGIICVFGYGGQVNQFACGGGSVTTMVAHGGGLGTLAYNPAINGYTFTFTVGVTATFHSVLGRPGA